MKPPFAIKRVADSSKYEVIDRVRKKVIGEYATRDAAAGLVRKLQAADAMKLPQKDCR